MGATEPATIHFFPSAEELQEFTDSLSDIVPGFEHAVAQLRQAPGEAKLAGDLFRALHTIKGDAALLRVGLAVRIVHPLESVLARVRAGDAQFGPLLAEAVLLAMDRLEMAVAALTDGKPVDHLRLGVLLEQLEALQAATAEELEDAAARLVHEVTGFRPRRDQQVDEAKVQAATPAAASGSDLRLFRELGLCLEQRSPLFDGRIPRTLRLALATNEAAGRPVDPLQLEAAVYLHDLGMMFLPESVWLKVGALSPTERDMLRDHPLHAAGLLERMPGWSEAAQMVAQHHELPDGTGYPRRLSAQNTCAGAKLLAIVDAFEAVMLKHRHRGQSRSMLRAIAEVNACETQFAPEWIAPFNGVVRSLIEG